MGGTSQGVPGLVPKRIWLQLSHFWASQHDDAALRKLRCRPPDPPDCDAGVQGTTHNVTLRLLEQTTPQALVSHAQLCSTNGQVHAIMTSPLSPSRRACNTSGPGHYQQHDAALCDHTLTQVLSWLGVLDLAGAAGLVCKEWHRASICKEVWRRWGSLGQHGAQRLQPLSRLLSLLS
jgi:hypothetical protein